MYFLRAITVQLTGWKLIALRDESAQLFPHRQWRDIYRIPKQAKEINVFREMKSQGMRTLLSWKAFFSLWSRQQTKNENLGFMRKKQRVKIELFFVNSIHCIISHDTHTWDLVCLHTVLDSFLRQPIILQNWVERRIARNAALPSRETSRNSFKFHSSSCNPFSSRLRDDESEVVASMLLPNVSSSSNCIFPQRRSLVEHSCVSRLPSLNLNHVKWFSLSSLQDFYTDIKFMVLGSRKK
jgi:hypothetical protein